MQKRNPRKDVDLYWIQVTICIHMKSDTQQMIEPVTLIKCAKEHKMWRVCGKYGKGQMEMKDKSVDRSGRKIDDFATTKTLRVEDK